MRKVLENLLDKAYVPYSSYPVACLLEIQDGTIIEGVNVENASYGATICAERNAITTAIAKGYKKGDFKAIHVMVRSDKMAYPCFLCRQVLEEFFTGEEDLYLYTNKEVSHEKIKEILVKPFNGENLQ